LRRTRLGYRAAVEVVFIAGWGRSGSTLLGGILGEIPGFLSVGELRHLFHPGVTCGCGAAAAECPFWLAVTTRASEELGGIDPAGFMAAQRRGLAPKRVPAILRGRRDADVEHASRVMAALRRGAAAEAGARIVVDGSKHPGDAAVLGAVSGASIVHLVRDPRATTYSWSRRRREGQQALGPLKASLRWLEWNTLAELVARRAPVQRAIRLRYEDLVCDPVAAVARVCRLVAIEPPDGLLANGTVTLARNHMLAGNPSKFRTGAVPVVADSAWQGELDARDRLLVVAAAWPLMFRYGYLPGR
jgi:hypothetical protein